jgi:lysophospholipase L1-like esterase
MLLLITSPLQAFAAGKGGKGGGGSTTTKFYYTALGDSISAGTDNTSLLIGRSYAYPNLIRDKIKATGKDVVFTNKSVPGHTTTDLLNKLNTDYSTQTAVKYANLITICIGGNNVLSAGSNSGYTEINDSKASAGVVQFGIDLPKIIDKIKTLNTKNPIILIMNLYNPYHPKEWGCVNTNGENEYGYLHNLIYDKYLGPMNDALAALVVENPNIKIVGTYSAFENEARFTNVTYTRLATGEEIILSPYYAKGTTNCTDTYTNFYNYPYRPFNTPYWRDPHPKSLGHNIIANAHWSILSGLIK